MSGPLTAQVRPAVRGRAGQAHRIRPGAWTIDLLGPLEVRRAGLPVDLPRRRRSLLALLALRAGSMVTDDGLVDALWGRDAPQTAVRTLHSHVAKLGAALSADGDGNARLIRRRDPGYLLDAGAARIDRVRFEELAEGGLRSLARGRCPDAARVLAGALALWRGGALSDAPVHGWALTEVDYLHGLRLQAREGMFAARLASGPPNAGVAELERLVAEEPLRERLWELLIVALHLSGRTGDALHAYHRVRRELLDELGLEPGEGLRGVEAGVLRGSSDPRALLRLAPEEVRVREQGPTGPLSLPQQVSPLIGREADLRETGGLLRASRLVTLTGFGGVGKSRLAVAAARAASAEFSEVVFLDLSALNDGEGVADAIAEAMGVPAHGPGSVLERLARRVSCDRVLLVADNCERAAGACALVVRDLLRRCPHLRVLATSQAALRVPGETLKTVAPLRVPPPAPTRSGADLIRYAAAGLFAERAGLGRLETLSGQDARAVAAICARCHGLPLALELAAARTRVFGLPELAERLRDPFEVLADGPLGARPHHRALRTTVEWGYHLLTPGEKRALRRFSVFVGVFGLEDAGAVHVETASLDMVSRLADKSLLEPVQTAEGTRYVLLDVVRRYALDQLKAHPDEYFQARRDHASRYRRRTAELERRFQGRSTRALMEQITERYEDVRSAFMWSIEEDPESSLSLAASLWRYHHLSGRHAEGREWLASALAACPAEVPAAARAKALWAKARLDALGGDYGEAAHRARQALELSTEEGDQAGTARSLVLLGEIAMEQGDYGQALELGRRSHAAAVRGGDRLPVGHALRLLGSVSWLAGDPSSAARFSGEAAHHFRRTGDREQLSRCLLDLGAAALYAGEAEAASGRLQEALLLSFGLRFKEGIAWSENLLALLDLRLGRSERASRRLVTALGLHGELGIRWRQASVLEAAAAAIAGREAGFAAELLGAADRIRLSSNVAVPGCERPELERTRAFLTGRLGRTAFDDAHAMGRWHEAEILLKRFSGLVGSVRPPCPAGR